MGATRHVPHAGFFLCGDCELRNALSRNFEAQGPGPVLSGKGGKSDPPPGPPIARGGLEDPVRAFSLSPSPPPTPKETFSIGATCACVCKIDTAHKRAWCTFEMCY
jgi:hypothetical protein